MSSGDRHSTVDDVNSKVGGTIMKNESNIPRERFTKSILTIILRKHTYVEHVVTKHK